MPVVAYLHTSAYHCIVFCCIVSKSSGCLVHYVVTALYTHVLVSVFSCVGTYFSDIHRTWRKVWWVDRTATYNAASMREQSFTATCATNLIKVTWYSRKLRLHTLYLHLKKTLINSHTLPCIHVWLIPPCYALSFDFSVFPWYAVCPVQSLLCARREASIHFATYVCSPSVSLVPLHPFLWRIDAQLWYCARLTRLPCVCVVRNLLVQ